MSDAGTPAPADVSPQDGRFENLSRRLLKFFRYRNLPGPDDVSRDLVQETLRRALERFAAETSIEVNRLDELPRVQALAQHRDSYIVASDERGLVLVDQHVAHERVLYERYLEEAADDRVSVQRLLFPVVLDLPPEEALLAEEQAEELRRLGFRLEPFGGNEVRLDGIPSLAAGLDPSRLLRELLEDASAARSARADAEGLRHRFVTTAACKAAIKIHHPLSREAMQKLIDDLFRTANPTTCPHGRPILFRLEDESIERAFRRR